MKAILNFALPLFLGLVVLPSSEAMAGRHFWNPCEVVSVEACPTNSAILNITLRLARSQDKEGGEGVTPTSAALVIPVKKGAYELDMNVQEWKAWSRGEAETDGFVYMTVIHPVWKEFGRDGLLTVTIRDAKGSIPDNPVFRAVMSAAFDWPGDKSLRSVCMRAIDKELDGDYGEAVRDYQSALDTYDADVWLFSSLGARRCRLQAELEKMAADPVLATADNYYRAGLYAMQSGLWRDAAELLKKSSALDAAYAEKAACCLALAGKYAACEPWSEIPAGCSGHLPEGRDITLGSLREVTGLDIQCWTNSVFFYVSSPRDYSKPAGAAYVRRYFKDCRYFNNYLNLDGELDAAFRYVKEGRTNDLLFVRGECIAPFMALLPKADECFLGVLTVNNVLAGGGGQKIGVFNLPAAVIGDYPQDGTDVLKFSVGETEKTRAMAEAREKARKALEEARKKAQEESAGEKEAKESAKKSGEEAAGPEKTAGEKLDKVMDAAKEHVKAKLLEGK